MHFAIGLPADKYLDTYNYGVKHLKAIFVPVFEMSWICYFSSYLEEWWL